MLNFGLQLLLEGGVGSTSLFHFKRDYIALIVSYF